MAHAKISITKGGGKIVDLLGCAGQSCDARLAELLQKLNIDPGQARIETKPEYAEPDQTTTVLNTEIDQ